MAAGSRYVLYGSRGSGSAAVEAALVRAKVDAHPATAAVFQRHWPAAA